MLSSTFNWLVMAYVISTALTLVCFEILGWKKSQRFRIENKELDELFPAFCRTDGVHWSRWRYYMCIFSGLGFLRVMLGFPFFLSSCFYGSFALIGHDRSKPLTGLRWWSIRIVYAMYSQTIVSFIMLIRTTHNRRTDYDYSYYLGPDYKKTQKLPQNVSTIVMNHQSWIDNIIAVVLFHPAFMIKAEVLKVPFVGEVLAGLKCQYVERFATKEFREQAVLNIVDR